MLRNGGETPFENMEIYWKDENRLVINEKEYSVE